MKEPIEYFFEKKGFDLAMIKSYIIGKKYIAIMLTNGNTGVCSTLGTTVNDSLLKGAPPDTSDLSHRIILNAWFNALCNYDRSYSDFVDIFDRISFKRYRSVVMVGYFETLHKKFTRDGIPLRVFDIHKESSILSDLNVLEESLSAADALILTGTTIFNGTFIPVTSSTPDSCDIFLLGPSNILSEDMFNYKNIKVVFGSVFNPYDQELMTRIGSGCGTKGFLDRLQKVYITSENILP